MITTTQVNVYKIEFCCDKCRVPVEYTGINKLTDPPKLGHKCPKCGREYWLTKVSPSIEYR